jgi:hypothetical protein
MKSQSRKAKGRKFQNFIAETLTAFFGWEEGDAESRSMGSGGVDIMLSPRARRDFPFSIESKSTRQQPGPAALKQSQSNKYEGTIACVVWKPHGASQQDAVVMMRFSDLLSLARRLSS